MTPGPAPSGGDVPAVPPEAAAELFATELYDEGVVTEVIRPAAVVPEPAARRILAELAVRDVTQGGLWRATPRTWRRYASPAVAVDGSPAGDLIGSIEVAYGTPTRYEITLYRATVTRVGAQRGWTVETLCDEPLGYGGLALATCPRASLRPPPKPFRLSDRPPAAER